MEKDKAEKIVAGTKTVEFRDFTPFYHSRFYDKAVLKWIDKNGNDPTISDEEFACADPVRPVRSIHFYSYNNTWSLDVAIKETGIVALTAEGIRMMHERFNCYELDGNYEYCNANSIPETERPLYFYLAIDRILNKDM